MDIMNIIMCTLVCGVIVTTTLFASEIIVDSFIRNDNDYKKDTDKKDIIESDKIVTLHKDLNGKSIFLLKDKDFYSFYVETSGGYYLDKQNTSDCCIKTIGSNETPHIDAVREYTEIEIVKKVPWFIYLCSLLSLAPCNIGNKYDIDEQKYYIIYIPQDSNIEI